MKYQILKQYVPGNNSVWVGSLGNGDPIEIFDTLNQAESRLAQLKKENPDRDFKIITVEK